MAENTAIEWTDATWQIVTGCSIKSPGCMNCYAMRMAATRLRNHPSRVGLTHEINGHHVWTGEVRFNRQWLDQPLTWKKPRDIFVAAHGDLFHESVPLGWITDVFDMMARCPWHRFQVLTKRPGHALDLIFPRPPMPHVWIGSSVERQQEADERRQPLGLLAELGWNTWISYEPALGQVDWTGWEFVRWFVSGGESGPSARPSHPDWHRRARDWCAATEVPYFFKQWGAFGPEGLSSQAWICRPDGSIDPYPTPNGIGHHRKEGYSWIYRVGKKAAGALLDGRLHREMPT